MTSFTLINVIVMINGIYDILCSLCILQIINIPTLNTLHVTMFSSNDVSKLSEREKRILAYWILTYGWVRLLIGLTDNKILVCITYFVEVAAIYNEWFIHKQIVTNIAISVIIISAIFGILCLF